MFYSIVIPCKNEEKYILKLLDSIAAQSVFSVKTPIYLADAGSTDGTLQMVEAWKAANKANLQVVEGGMPPAGRNNGAKFVTTTYVLFLDADIVLGETNTIEKVLVRAENENLDLLVTRIRVSEGNWFDKLFFTFFSLFARLKLMGPVAAGMFVFIRKEVFDTIGGFNEKMLLGDDVELARHISKNKYALVDTFIWTSNRRFKKYGYVRTVFEYLAVFFSKKSRMKDSSAYFDPDLYR